ncbi:MAG TPA: UDP-3-O-(3-hydroxymyristoyl)glucosamine N-acyltransferase [Candidatus Acidoferrales bacterium]|jgi:UDP-3-O-[3-hydroxymyristoyl] glucosamine N-acyltransferase|nr:UDP-3-O-(3-hydroxymyristoyl)glucosamine N-acyltransferase [Candidatus Acidoferrales bacterium]
MKLGELAAKLNCKLDGGDETLEVRGVAGIERAQAGEITFLANPKYARELATTLASAALVEESAAIVREAGLPSLAALRSKNPYFDFARAIELFSTPPVYRSEIHPTAVIAKTAKIGEGAHVGPHCFVDEGVVIGRNAVLHSLVTIYRDAQIGDDFLAHSQTVVRERCRIGNRVIVQNGAVIGADGFGFAKNAHGRWHKIMQNAPVVIEDDVEIQANSCIDRASVGETRIRRGVKIDDLVVVGHACDVGEDTLLCGQVGLAGSTRVGRNCILAGQVGSAGHLDIAEGAIVTAQSGIHQDIPTAGLWSGSPLMDNKTYRKSFAAYKRLPELQNKLRKLAGGADRKQED